MAQTNAKATDWIHETVRALRRNGSWTGRIHVHKLLFMLKTLERAEVPFQFELYHYGPYSRNLDEDIACMEAFGELERNYPKSGYGPQYGVIDDHHAPGLSSDECDAISAMARLFGDKNSSNLELIATCTWVERVEKISSDSEIIDRVSQVKPKYNRTEIEQQLAAARWIAALL